MRLLIFHARKAFAELSSNFPLPTFSSRTLCLHNHRKSVHPIRIICIFILTSYHIGTAIKKNVYIFSSSYILISLGRSFGGGGGCGSSNCSNSCSQQMSCYLICCWFYVGKSMFDARSNSKFGAVIWRRSSFAFVGGKHAENTTTIFMFPLLFSPTIVCFICFPDFSVFFYVI